MLSVSSFGEVLIDLIPNDDGSLTPYVGGAPANVAAAVAKLGGDSCFIGGISHDGFGLKIRACLEQLGVRYHHSLLVKNKTALVAVSLDGDGERSFEFYRDNTADLSVNSSKLAKLDWSATDIFHFCSNTLVEDLLVFLRRLTTGSHKLICTSSSCHISGVSSTIPFLLSSSDR